MLFADSFPTTKKTRTAAAKHSRCVNSDTYCSAVALVTLFFSAWGVVGFASIALAYRHWLKEVEATL